MTKQTLIIGSLLVGAVIAGILMMLGSGENSGELQQRLSARHATTLKIIADGQKNLSDDELSKLNSELSIVLQGDDAALKPALADVGFKKASKEIVAAEADLATFEKLKNAKLNAQYDATYHVVLTQKLESLLALLQELHGATNSKTLKSVLATEHHHLTTFRDGLSQLN